MKAKSSTPFIPLLTGLSLVAGIGVTGTASAATISNSDMFSTLDSQMVTDTGVSSPTTAQNTVAQTIQLSQFDPSLGTLTGVTFNLTSTLSETGLSLSVSPQENGSDGSASADFTLTIDDGITSGALFDQTFIHSVSCSGSGPCTNADTTFDFEIFDDAFSAAVLAGYQGMSTYNVTVSQLIDLSATSAGGSDSGFASASFAGGWQGSIAVTYTYDEVVVPIPAAAWLFGSGLLGLLGTVKRKR